MERQNLLVIMSDQHSRKLLGCYGNPVVRTPNLDALAARGTRFSAAYTGSPVCIPARAVFATGKYIHQIGYWDNADPYDGRVPSWHHRLRDSGHRVDSIGKLHFFSEESDTGFSAEIIPMHVIGGKGDLMGLVRDELPKRGAAWKMAGLAGPGESSYTHYDREIAARAQIWLSEEASKHRDEPWVLFVSFVTPHYPLTAPPEHYYHYLGRSDLPLPKSYDRAARPDHPFVADYAGSFNFDDYFEDEAAVRRALAGYFGLCSFMDEQVGLVLRALERCGLSSDTRILYTSDHGDNLGARGLWGKSTMYEETIGVPLIIAGRDIPSGRVIDTPVSHVDVYPSILEATGIPAAVEDGRPGASLFAVAAGAEPDRLVLSEYHGMGSKTGAFALRHGRYKSVHYAAYRPQLFDLQADPEELVDLAGDPRYRGVLAECEARLRRCGDPAEIDARAKSRQRELIAANGGKEAVLRRGDLGFTPPPGVIPEFA
jgi:choline-sulfatase